MINGQIVASPTLWQGVIIVAVAILLMYAIRRLREHREDMESRK